MGVTKGNTPYERQAAKDNALALEQLDQEKRNTQAAEAERGQLQNELGSDQQLAGEPGYDPNAPDYSDYTYDANAGQEQLRETPFGKHRKELVAAQGQVDTANQHYAAARAAQARGDSQTAAAEAAQGDAIMQGVQGGAAGKYTSRNANTNKAAMGRLASPEGITVGRLVRTARDLQDRSSDIYKQYYSDLTGGAITSVNAGVTSSERALAAAGRTAQQQQNDQSRQFGVARNQIAELHAGERLQSNLGAQKADIETQAAAQRADIYSKASQALDTYSNQFAMDATKFAEDWIGNTAGVRDAFVENMANINTTTAGLFTNFADQMNQLDAERKSAEVARKKAYGEGWVKGMSAVGSIIGGMMK